MSDDKPKEPFEYYQNGDNEVYPWETTPAFTKDDGRTLAEWYGDKRHFRPWYDPNADYNTNAKSYYDYIGYRIRQLDYMIRAINDLLKRDVQIKDTQTVDMSKDGDWQKHDTILTLWADVKISQAQLNAIVVNEDGLWVKNLQPQMDDLARRMSALEGKVDALNSRIDKLQQQLNGLAALVAGFGSALTALETKLQNEIDQLKDQINTIYNILNGASYTKIPDTDFYHVWYNNGQEVPAGWGTVSAKILQTTGFSTVVISFPWANQNFQSMRFNGGHIPLSSTPESYVGGFGFRNKYASLNNMQVTNVQFSSDAPHVEPVSQRASWTIGYNLDTSKTIHDEPFQVTMASFADGYNSPSTLQDHYSGITMKGAPLTITLTLKGNNDSGGGTTPGTPPIPEGDGILCTPSNPNGVTGLTRTITRNINYYDENNNPSKPDNPTTEEDKDVKRTISFNGQQPITDRGVLG